MCRQCARGATLKCIMASARVLRQETANPRRSGDLTEQVGCLTGLEPVTSGSTDQRSAG
jgi:hypothetical protein